ncbi:MAG TPA: hypothetical protein VFZ09_39650 [Archangium sp.]|uniref:hypothetical protein n=1 Tax=Archangium sp. TaxID=1872627 RepID=UPI002E3713E5|nr:hypothetical protein [Archangium sp.]HEX5752388.1 hypothetical protein [Archangium sp.]
MKVGQNRPSVPTQSTTSTEARKGTPAAPARAPTARNANTFQTGFDTAVRKNTFTMEAAATPVVMTPAPPPETAAPGTAGSKLTDDQLKKALNEAHQMIFGRDVDPAQLDGWMNRARKLRDNPEDPSKPLSLDDIKYTLFSELRTGKTKEQLKTLDDPTLKRLVNDAYQLFAGPGTQPDAAKAKELLDLATQLRDHPEDPSKPLDADGIKYALFSKLRGTYNSDPNGKVTDAQLKKAVNDAYQLFAGPGAQPDAAKAKELLDFATQLRDKPEDPSKPLDADGIKYALFSKLRGTYNSDPQARLTDDQLKKALNEAHQMIFGRDVDPAQLDGWMNRARKLRDNPEDPSKPLSLDDIKFTLFSELRTGKTKEQLKTLDDPTLKRLVNDAYQLFAGPGTQPDPAKAKELLDLATQLRDKPEDPTRPLDADGIKYALFSKLRGTYNSDSKAKITDDQLRKLLDEAHNLVFGNGANGPNVETWMARARKLRDDKDNPLDANGIKYALFSQMRQVK